MLIAFLAVACAALRFASSVWLAVFLAITLSVYMAAAVTAALDRGPRQAFAIGFIVCAGVYFALVAAASGQGPFRGRLPTTILLKPLFEAVVVTKWYDSSTGKEMPNYIPSAGPFPNYNPNAGGGFPHQCCKFPIAKTSWKSATASGPCCWATSAGISAASFTFGESPGSKPATRRDDAQ